MDVLEGIADFVKFRISNELDRISAWACTSADISVHHPMGGFGSNIDINVVFLREMGWGSLTISQRLRMQFLIAACLMHECAHAIGYAVYPQDPAEAHNHIVEPFFENHRLAELGNAYEQVVFNGPINPVASQRNCKYGLFTQRWPHDNPQQPRGDDREINFIPVRTDLPLYPIATKYFVKMRWVQALFTEAFWAHSDRQGPKSLYPPKETGYRFVYAELTDDNHMSDVCSSLDDTLVMRTQGQGRYEPGPILRYLPEEPFNADSLPSLSEFASDAGNAGLNFEN